jgi:hypothetical protein
MIGRSSLFAKYAIPLIVLVSGALIVSGLIQIYFSYQESKSALARIQYEKAAAAAIRIEQFARQLEHDLSWIAQTPWVALSDPLNQRRLDSLRLLRQSPAITEVSHIDPTGHEQLRVSRLAMDVIGSNADFSDDPKFADAMARKIYFSRALHDHCHDGGNRGYRRRRRRGQPQIHLGRGLEPESRQRWKCLCHR